MAEYINREEFIKRIKPYDTSDNMDKALYNFALNNMMETPNANVIPIPEGATNGDMMKAVFPDKSTFNGGEGLYFKKDWWDAPYKKEIHHIRKKWNNGI